MFDETFNCAQSARALNNSYLHANELLKINKLHNR